MRKIAKLQKGIAKLYEVNSNIFFFVIRTKSELVNQVALRISKSN